MIAPNCTTFTSRTWNIKPEDTTMEPVSNTRRNAKLKICRQRKCPVYTDHHSCAFGKNVTQVTGFWKWSLTLDNSTFIQILIPPKILPFIHNTFLSLLQAIDPLYSVLILLHRFFWARAFQNSQGVPLLLCDWLGLEPCYNCSVFIHAYRRGKVKEFSKLAR